MGATQVTMRVVFDTNCVVSALLFAKGRLAWLRADWATGALVPLVCTQTVQELLRVLAYPKFDLAREEIDELLGDYLPFAEVVELDNETNWPECRDPDDRIFLALALQAEADALVTGDRDPQACRDGFPVTILTPDELKARLKKP